MEKTQIIVAGFVLGTGLLLAVPSIALADNDRPHMGINFSFGVPVYEQPTYVYARPRQEYAYSQPGAGYYQRGYDNRGYEQGHRQWRDHHHEYQHHDENDD